MTLHHLILLWLGLSPFVGLAGGRFCAFGNADDKTQPIDAPRRPYQQVITPTLESSSGSSRCSFYGLNGRYAAGAGRTGAVKGKQQ